VGWLVQFYCLSVTVGVVEGVTLGLGVLEREGELLGVIVGVIEGVGVTDLVGEGLRVPDGEAGLGVRDGVEVGVTLEWAKQAPGLQILSRGL